MRRLQHPRLTPLMQVYLLQHVLDRLPPDTAAALRLGLPYTFKPGAAGIDSLDWCLLVDGQATAVVATAMGPWFGPAPAMGFVHAVRLLAAQ